MDTLVGERQTVTMLQPGEIYEGVVVQTEHYGVYLEVEDARVLVLIVDISWKAGLQPYERYNVGDTERVKILFFNSTDKIYKGSIKDVYEENPFVALADQVGSIVSGTVHSIRRHDGEATVVLPNGRWGRLMLAPGVSLSRGEPVRVRIAAVRIPENEVDLELPGAGE